MSSSGNDEHSGYYSAKAIFTPILNAAGASDSRPRVTLTFAQSLDGKIARPGEQLLLSGARSMEMTHCLRTMHDGIMVGIGTVLCDNPRLSARLVPKDEQEAVANPQPIVLDTHLRIPTQASLLTGPKHSSKLKMPWIIAGPGHDREKKRELEQLGAHVIVIDGAADAHGRPRLESVLHVLGQLGIKRLMVEGGAHVIQSCLASGLADLLVITTAPTLVGSSGVPAVPTARGIPSLAIQPLAYKQFGPDVVMIANTASL